MPIKMPTPTETPMTIEVSLVASFLVGQLTFVSSVLTSFKNLTGFSVAIGRDGGSRTPVGGFGDRRPTVKRHPCRSHFNRWKKKKKVFVKNSLQRKVRVRDWGKRRPSTAALTLNRPGVLLVTSKIACPSLSVTS